MASSLKNRFEEMAKPEEKPVVKAKKIHKVRNSRKKNHPPP